MKLHVERFLEVNKIENMVEVLLMLGISLTEHS